VKAGDVVRILTPGGGGWGDPLARVTELVRQDVVKGLVSLDRASSDYGVVLEPTSDPMQVFDVDEAATAKLRDEMRAARPGLKMINRGEHVNALIESGTIEVSDFDDPAQFDEQAYLKAVEAA
jgi:N-methylhydantoinase B